MNGLRLLIVAASAAAALAVGLGAQAHAPIVNALNAVTGHAF